ncbi:MAG: hypothetical protein HS113_11630 [Verrucomicrobiales bacterium]|nr:hypothetical protein [Verrucomicrobiales bacterium]
MNLTNLRLGLLGLATAGVLVFAGCSKPDAIDTRPVTQAFASSESAIKTDLDAAVAAVKAGDYAGAANKLQSLAANAQVTSEQKQALQGLLTQVQTKLGDAAKQAIDQASKVATNAAKSAGDAASKVLQDASKKVGDAANKAVQDATKALPPLPPSPTGQ